MVAFLATEWDCVGLWVSSSTPQNATIADQCMVYSLGETAWQCSAAPAKSNPVSSVNGVIKALADNSFSPPP